MVLVRLCRPPPHPSVQKDQLVQSDIRQSVEHACVLHNWVCLRRGHFLPPFFSLPVINRIRCCSPAPHGLSHFPQSLHFETVQSCEHGCRLQGVTSFSCGHKTLA